MIYRTVVIGTGSWGKVWIEHIKKHSQLEIAAIVTRTKESLLKAIKEHSIPLELGFTDVRRALSERESDLVVVVSPAACHLDHVCAAMEASRHVICEKPIAGNWNAAVEIAQAVKSHPKQKFMVSQTRRFNDVLYTIRETIAKGKIGKLC